MSAMRQIQNLIILILAALTLAGVAGDPSSPPDLNTGGDDWVTVKAQTALYRDLRYMGHRLSVETAQGVVTLREFVLATDDQSISEIMRGELATLDPLEPANGAARRVADEDLAAMPVVARDGRLLGAVTIDVAMRQIAPSGWSQQVPRVFS